ncbi:MAG: cell division protein FtsL [Pseudomonadota bacterium]
MRSLMYIIASLTVMALAVWAYQQNYATQAALREVEKLHVAIGHERERLSILRAEWAYLNRPERLRELAFMNFDRLGLLPITPDHFGEIDAIAMPGPVLPRDWDAIWLAGRADDTQEARP